MKNVFFYLRKKIPFSTTSLNTYYCESLIANLNFEKLNEFYIETQKEDFDPELFYLNAGINKIKIDITTIKEIEDKYKNKNFNNLYQNFFSISVYFGLARFWEKKDKIKSEHYYHNGNSLIKIFKDLICLPFKNYEEKYGCIFKF